MEFIVLKDNTKIQIEEGASLDHIVHIAEDETAAVDVCAALTPQNVESVTFIHEYEGEEQVVGEYTDLILMAAPVRQDTEDEKVSVTFGLREKTSVELRLDALEEGQAVQDGAIEDLGIVVSEMGGE